VAGHDTKMVCVKHERAVQVCTWGKRDSFWIDTGGAKGREVGDGEAYQNNTNKKRKAKRLQGMVTSSREAKKIERRRRRSGILG
jgi:hypothetical protein